MITNYAEYFQTKKKLKSDIEMYRLRVEQYENRLLQRIENDTWLALVRNRNWCLCQIGLIKKRLRLMEETGRTLGLKENI